jgi:two-component system sensor histidine kinase ChvG
VSVHDGRIVQILDNLLGNAVSFAPADTQIIFSIDLGEDGKARLQVRDQGPGIPPGRLQEIFTRFYSERPESEAFGEHSGLGLSIAQQIAHGYGGDLIASNEEGACFTLSLPVAKA